MNRRILLLQFVLTLFILAFVPGNSLKTVVMLVTWAVTFGEVRSRELIAFIGINLLFVVSDIGAIQNGFFEFTHPSFLGLPAWEFFMWGFYLLHLHRMLPPKVPKKLDPKLLVLALIFSQLFGIVSDRTLLLALTSGILALSLVLHHEKDDVAYCAYLMILGAAVEYVGLSSNLWRYPERDYSSALVQFVVMWGAAGLYFRHLLAHWLSDRRAESVINRERHELLSLEIRDDFEEACRSADRKQAAEALSQFEKIEEKARRSSIALNYQFHVRYSDLCIATGNLRKAVELSRDGLCFTTSNLERAFLHLQLCRVYRMMILMQNARTELNRAFAELGLVPPRDSILHVIKAIVRSVVPSFKTDFDRESLQLQVALYEEAGLSAYYFIEYWTLLQCSLLSHRPARLLGDSIENLNWLGGSACVWAVLGWTSRAAHLMKAAETLAARLPAPYAAGKIRLWWGLYYTYTDRSQMAAEEFSAALENPNLELTPFDRRLMATTLSCNYLIRGRMREAEAVIRHMTDREIPRCRYFSSGKAFVDYYRLPALAFLGAREEARDVLKKSEAVFNRVDEEKWQITLFIGGLLMAHYATLNSSNVVDSRAVDPDDSRRIQRALARFDALRLSPRWTFLEAAQIWAVRAHLFVELALAGHVSSNEAEKTIRQLGRVRKNSDLRAHYLIAKAKSLLLPGRNPSARDRKRANEMCKEALRLAESQGNIWIQFEALRFEELKQKANVISPQLRKFAEHHGWQEFAL